MTLEQLEKRIAKLRSRPLVLLCRMPDGQEKRMTVTECISTGSSFLRVVDGDDLADLDRLLKYEYGNLEVFDSA